MVDSLIPEDYRAGRILDIGCGSYPLFLDRTRFAVKYGIDGTVAVNAVLHDITLMLYDVASGGPLPFGEGYFDVITMLAVVEHLERRELLILMKEIYRVLKFGGLYILTTPAPWTEPILRILAKLRLVSPLEIGEHKEAYSRRRMIEILQNVPFPLEQIKLGHFELFLNTWAVAKK